MSWQAYVDDQLLGTGSVKQAIIMGLDGGAWAASAGFALQGAEGANLVKAFSSPGDVFGTGIHIAGTKYFTLKADERSVYGKSGAAGVVCVKCTQCVLVAVYDETIQPGMCTTVVERLADFLIDSGF